MKKSFVSKLLSVLFGIILFLLVGISCVKPIATSLIRDAYVGSAFSFRINDVIHEACPEMELDSAIELQEFVEKHPRLNQVIHNYLCAYDQWIAQEALPEVDNGKALQRLNRDILKETKAKYTGMVLSMEDEEFLRLLTSAEEEVEIILEDRIPRSLFNYGELSILAIRTYRVMTSGCLMAGMFAVLLVLAFGIYKVTYEKQRKAFGKWLGKTFLIQGILWLVLAGGLELAGAGLLPIVDRLLGRSMFVEAAPLLWRSAVLVVIGGIIEGGLGREIRSWRGEL